MRKLLTIIISLFTQTLFSQNDIPDFEFGHNIDPEFYYEFIDDNVPYLDLTQDKFFDKRQKLKITQITVNHIGKSCDPLFLNDTASFKYFLQSGRYDHGYSYVEIYNFDKKGYKISKREYPVSKYLTKKDSIVCDQRRTDYVRLGDSLIVSTYFRDTINEKAVYLDKIVYRNIKGAIQIMAPDSINKGYSSKVVGYTFFATKYYYNKDNKIVKVNSKQSEHSYELNFTCPNPTLTLINCSYRKFWVDSIKSLENKIVKNNLGQILTSTFNYGGIPDEYSSYILSYDKNNNLSKIIRRVKAKDWFDHTDNLYELKHTYKNGKLIKTQVHYNFGVVNNNIKYFYNDKGLLSQMDMGWYKVYYDYTQDKK